MKRMKRKNNKINIKAYIRQQNENFFYYNDNNLYKFDERYYDGITNVTKDDFSNHRQNIFSVFTRQNVFQFF